MRYGGWLDEKTPERFARYCERVTKHLGDLIGAACTVNEPNLPVLLVQTAAVQHAGTALVECRGAGLWGFA